MKAGTRVARHNFGGQRNFWRQEQIFGQLLTSLYAYRK